MAVLLPALTTTSTAQDAPAAAESDAGETPPADARSLVVSVQDGAESPRAAVAAFVAAAQAGDVEAVLAMIDPRVRPLVSIEVLLEEYMIEKFTLRDRVMTEEERSVSFNHFGAIPVVYAKQDMLRTREITVREERPSAAGDDKVLLDVDWRVRSWSATDRDESDCIAVTMLAVRREERWYLFSSFGAVVLALLESDESVLRSDGEDPTDEEPGVSRFRMTYRLPIEVVHEELAAVSQSGEAEDLIVQGRDMGRFIDALRNRVMRGDFSDLKELDAALVEAEQVCESLVIRHGELYLQAVRALDGKLQEGAAAQ
jgi:hypothetical protein